MSTCEHKCAERLLEKCRKDGLIHPVTGEGSPTAEMIAIEIRHAIGDSEREADELAAYSVRLVRALRKHDPSNPIAIKAVEYLTCIGRLKPTR